MKYSLMDYLRWAGEAVAVIVIIVLFFMWNGQRKKVTKTLDQLTTCLNSPADTVVIHDSIVIYKSQPYKPKPLRHETRLEIPKIPVDTGGVLCEEEYRDTYTYEKNGDFGRFVWQAKIRNCQIMEMDFSEIVFPKQIVTITRKVDTCITKPVEEISKSHLWLTIKPGMVIYPFTVSNVSVGINYTVRQKWGIGAAVGYDWKNENPIADITISLGLDNLKKKIIK